MNSEMRLQSLADSPLLKVLQYVVTYILLPLLALTGQSMLNKMDKIDEGVQHLTTTNATLELRLHALEARRDQDDVAERLLSEKVIRSEERIQQLEGQLSKGK